MKPLAALVVRVPWLFIALFVAVTLGFAAVLPEIEIDPEIKNQLPDDMPARVNMVRVEERFGGSELLMVVLTAPDITEPAVLRRLSALSDGLEEVPGVERVLGLFTLPDIQGTDGMMTVERAVEDLPESPVEREALAARLRDNPLVYGNVVSPGLDAAATIALIERGASDAEATAAVEALIAATPGPGDVVVGGMPSVRTEMSRDIRSDMRRFVPVGLLVILGFLYVCFRQLRGVVLPFTVVVMSVIVAMGLIPLLGWKVQMVTVILPVILLAVANDYGIHLMARFQEENVPGAVREGPALARRVLEDLGVPVIAAGITTMAGLLCLTTHIVVPARQLGVLAAVGVVYALCCSLLFIPSVLAVLPVPAPVPALSGERRGGLEGLLERTAGLVTRRPRAVLGIVGLFALAASAGVGWLQVDTNPVNYYTADAPVARTSRVVNAAFGGSTELSVMVGGDIQDPALLRRIERFEERLRELPEVGYTSSVVAPVKRMNRALLGGDPSLEVLPDSREAVAQYFLMYGMGGDPSDLERMVDFGFEHALITARINSVSTQDIGRVVTAVKGWVAEDLADRETVVGGFGPVFTDLVDAIVRGQIASLSLSLVLVFVLVAAAFRSLAAGLYATLPLLVAIPVLFGLMGFAGIELNIVTAMLSSIMIGVGVDYTIHFLWRYRAERHAGLDAPEAVARTLTTAGRGIVFNALSVVAGFGVLLISNFLPVKFFGFLVVVSISACLAGALVLLPALCLVARPRFLEPPVTPAEVALAG